MLNILLISPLGYAINSESKYTGIERLVWENARGLAKTHKVSVLAHSDSVFPDGVIHYKTLPNTGDIFCLDELKQYQSWQTILKKFDVIHDFSHQHFASRYNANLPSLNIFWHAPSVAKFPKSSYNIIGLSEWACKEFERVYHQKAVYQQSILIDTSFYKHLPYIQRTDRFLCLGRITSNKGVFETCLLCRNMNVPLDIVGKGDKDDYERIVREMCDGTLLKYHGEVTDEEKIKFLQRCKALIYIPQEPEVTNHKLQEAMLCGTPVIVRNLGAMSEIVTQGVDGYLCDSPEDFTYSVSEVAKLEPLKTLKQNTEKYSIEKVVSDYIPLYEKVRDGLRW